jgi:gamma-glutamyltranspeptidase/glutathione hydrolase
MGRVLGVLGTLLAVLTLAAVPNAGAREGSRMHPGVSGRLGVVATESPAAARVGRAVLQRGGNAIDAAVATVFALGVARPQSCGIGGGGFLLYRSRTGAPAALDFRETAPAAIQPDTFTGGGLYETFTGHTTIGVPGTVAGMAAALRRYGTLSLAKAIAPAERLAREGFVVPGSLGDAVRANARRLALFPASAAIWLPGGTPVAAGSRLVQPEMAATLRRLRRDGPAAFYRGPIARAIVADAAAARPELGDTGLLTVGDFAAYRARWRTALRGSYRDRQILAEPPPTSGGTALIEMLNLLEGFDLRAMGPSSADALHVIAEAQRIAWADRGAYLADPDHVAQPIAQLTSKAYADARRGEISLQRTTEHGAGAVAALTDGDARPEASTTHVSVIDARGNAVAVTCTIEQEFGSAVVAPGLGFLLNNELTDFGAPGSANEPRPGKRPRSSISPTIVVRDGRPEIVTGAAGGARIVMGPLFAVVGVVDWGRSLAQAVDAERADDQGSARLNIEDARVDPAVLAELERRGWTLVREGEYGARPRMQIAGAAPDGLLTAVSDSRSDQASLAVRRPRSPRSARPAPPRSARLAPARAETH